MVVGLATSLPVDAGPAQATGPAPGSTETAILTVTVNGVGHGTHVVELTPDGDVLLPESVLATIGLDRLGHVVPGATRLSSLDPGLEFEIDEKAVELRIRLPPERLGSATLDLSREAETGTMIRANNAFLNYSASASRDFTADFWSFDLPLEAGLNLESVLVSGQATLSRSGDGAGWDRGPVRATRDVPGRARRYAIGDIVASSGRLGASGAIGGISVRSNFALDPALLKVVPLRLDVPVVEPATVEVFVNGGLVSRSRAAPGELRLRGLPIPPGANDIEVVLRYDDGTVRRLDATYFGSSTLLREGMHEYSYNVGFLRDLDSNFGYGDPALIAFHRYGAAQGITLGARTEAGPGLLNAGAGATLLLQGIGEIDLRGALSRHEGTGGHAAALDYSYLGGGFGFLASTEVRSAGYATTAALEAGEPRPGSATRWTHRLTLTLQGGAFGALSLSGRLIDDGDRRENVLRAAYQHRLWRGATLRAFVDRTDVPELGEPDLGAGASLTLDLDGGHYGRLRYDYAARDRTAELELSRNSPTLQGLDYRVEAGLESDAGAARSGTGRASARYTTADIELSASIDRSRARTGLRARASGSLVWMEGTIHASRPIRNGFTLVRVADLAGVPVRFRNQTLGRTGEDGSYLVPGLVPYGPNAVSVSAGGLPFGTRIERPSRSVTTPIRGGGVLEFDVSRIQAVTGKLVMVVDGERQPAEFAGLTVHPDGDDPVESVIGRDGLFFLEHLSRGEHAAEARLLGRTCRFTIVVPESDAFEVDIGTIECRARAGDAGP